MKRKRYLMNLLAAMVLLASCNESLEDTYSDYVGDGKIHYIAKCSGLEVKPGWERVELAWKNGKDAMIKNVKVSWTVSGVKHDSLLDQSATSCNIKNLRVNETYRIDVCAVDKDGKESLLETKYVRPYTSDNEAVRSFTRAVTKYYKLKDHLVFFLDRWNSNLVEINLLYTDTDGKAQVYPLTKEVFTKGFITLSNVNTEKPISITRLGKLEGCPDLIRFNPYVLGDERYLTSDFKTAVQLRYGIMDQTVEQKEDLKHFVDTVRVLEFDYDMITFEDVLYCPKLEKLVLGKNRYLNLDNKTNADKSTLTEEKRSLQVLDVANELRGLKVERYNEHYFTQSRDYIKALGNPTLPDLNCFPKSAFKEISSSIKENIGYDANLIGLLDNDQSTWWDPDVSDSHVREFVLTITLEAAQLIHGFKVAQIIFASSDKNSMYYAPNQVKIEVSYDQLSWKNVSYLADYPLGRGSGEITLVPMANPQEAKYIRVTVSDQAKPNSKSSNVLLADIVPY